MSESLVSLHSREHLKSSCISQGFSAWLQQQQQKKFPLENNNNNNFFFCCLFELCCSKEDPIGLWSWEGEMVLCHLLQRLQIYYLPHTPMLNHWLPLLLHLTWLPKTWSHCLVSPIIHTYLLTYLLILNKLKKWERKKEREWVAAACFVLLPQNTLTTTVLMRFKSTAIWGFNLQIAYQVVEGWGEGSIPDQHL